jgi:choline kinase
MDLNKIYFVINEILDAYIVAGIKPEHLLTFLNADEDNYKFVYNQVYRKLNLQNIQFESSVLTECLQDSIRDKVGVLNDISKSVTN